MKQKNYFEDAKSDLHHFDLVRRLVYALYPLRQDKRKTEEYFNRYLFADARLRGGIDTPLWEDEVDPAEAPAVRLEILNMIAGDDSFEYARNIIMRGEHRYRLPDNYNSILHDPPLPGQYKEEDWQIKAYNLGMEILNELKVKDMVKELVDITLKHGVNGKNNPYPIKEVEKLEEDLQEREKLNAALKERVAQLEGELERLRIELDDGAEGEVMTVSQLALFAVYLFAEVGLHFGNSDKTEWARLLHRITGKSEQRIRNALNIDFDSKIVQKNLRLISTWCSVLFPQITDKIVKDLKN